MPKYYFVEWCVSSSRTRVINADRYSYSGKIVVTTESLIGFIAGIVSTGVMDIVSIYPIAN